MTSRPRTQYYTAASLDGFLADPEHNLDWLMQFSEGPLEDFPPFLAAVGAIAMGSHTYEWMLRHLIDPVDGPPQPWPYTQPAWVFTTRPLPSVPGADLRFVQGDVRPVHRAMTEAAEGRNLWVLGGGELVGQFHDHGLLDELIVSVTSVTLGAGAPLLPRRITTPPLRLTSARTYGSGFVVLTYDVPARTPTNETGSAAAPG
jgi:dihydrofolate reductase